MPTQHVHSSQAKTLVDEHQRLEKLVENLRRIFFAEYAAPPTVVVGLLRQLAENLRKHFLHEEQGGYFAEVVEQAPRMQGEIDRLLVQHEEFSRDLDAMCRIANSGDAAGAWWFDLAERFEEFVERFIDHEHAENGLLQEAYGRDIGAED